VVKTTQLPWHYILTWVLISTPLLYVGLFIVGIFATLRTAVLRHWRLWQDENELQDLIFLGLFIVPIAAVVILHSTLYDGWRQLYFVYPVFLLLAIKGWVLLRKHQYAKPLLQQWFKPALSVILCISFAWTGLWMLRAHPLQNVYFNALAGKNVKAHFDVDYWGLSNRIAIEHILKEFKEAYVSVWTPSYPKLWITKHIFNLLDQSRLIEVGSLKENPQYIVQTYRMDANDYVKNNGYEIVKSVVVGDEIILTILRMPLVPREQITPNHPIFFHEKGEGKRYIKMPGWSFIESWGIWSSGQQGSLELPLSSALQNRAITLNLELRPFITPSHPQQRVQFRINGQLIKTHNFDHPGTQKITLTIPAELNQNSDLMVNLRYLDPVTPKSVGIGADTRLLAIGIESLSIR